MADPQLSYGEVISDIRELVSLLETSHPDPYLRGGGRVAFHRRVFNILDSIPATGLTAKQLLRRLRPLVASVRDGHTHIDASQEQRDPRRTSIELQVVGERIYVSGVGRAQDRPVLGQRVTAVEGVAWGELLDRMADFRGADNAYHNLIHLIEAIRRPELLADFLGRDAPLAEVRIDLESATGARSTSAFPLNSAADAVIRPMTRVTLPTPNAGGLAWGFLTEDRSVAILRIESMMSYREAFQGWRSTGFNWNLGDHLNAVVQRATGQIPPDGLDARIELVPAATDTFMDLFAAMNEAGTSTLMVDLRNSGGGSARMSMILGYFLYPVDRLIERDGGYQVTRFSRRYLENFEARSIGGLRAELWNLLEVGDLDFSEETAWRRIGSSDLDDAARARRLKDLADGAAATPAFDALFRRREANAIWRGKVMVLMAAHTYSASFYLAAMLVRHGARTVGVPSAQAGNCFIQSLPFRLAHSGLTGSTSCKCMIMFPDDPEKGEVLRPEVELTYEYLASKDFDPNASVLLALENSE